MSTDCSEFPGYFLSIHQLTLDAIRHVLAPKYKAPFVHFLKFSNFFGFLIERIRFISRDEEAWQAMLEELCQQRQWRLPEYSTTMVGLVYAPWFYATVTVNGFDFHTVNAFRSSQAHQNEAAKDALDHLSNHLQPTPSNPTPGPSSFPQPCLPSSSSAPYCSDMQHLSKNQLQTYAQKRNLLPPVYSCEQEGPHNSRFKCRVTIGGQTYEGQEFLPTVKDAERAAAKAALTSILPNGVQEDHSGLYKNLLQEFTQKAGFYVPVYSSRRISGEPHVLVFISSVEIQGERFMGEEARSKKQAESSPLRTR